MATRGSYTKEFKEEAVRLAKQNGFAQTERDLGACRSVIRKWKNKLESDGEAAFPGKGHVQDEELVRLRRVQEENEIRRAISPR